MTTDPVFVFDSHEEWFPVGVEESFSAVDVRLRGGMFDGKRAEVAHLRGAVRLDFPAGMKQPGLPSVGYRRVAEGGGLWWAQHWLWYLYNPWSVAGVGRHEGDWEFVQVGYGDPALARPVLVTGSEHHSGGKREAWACELTPAEGRPKVYVALGSHANYFAPGTQGSGVDRCDGRGPILSEIEWRAFGAWATWPGRWGNSTGEGKSPESPGCQGVRWHAPHLYHSASAAA